jgi:hypothetical protein
VDVQELLFRLLRFPWTMDQIMAGVLSFSLALLHSGPSAGLSDGAGAGTGTAQRRTKGPAGSADASALGAEVCLALFEAQPSAQRTILQELLGEMDASTGLPALYALFCRLASRHPAKLVPFIPKLRNLLYSLATLPPAVVDAFLRVLLPLLEHDAALRDTLFITLRKSLFSKDPRARVMALSGYLAILSATSAGPPIASSSQAPRPAQGPRPQGLEAYEILGNLKRCLTQQHEIRHQVYTGLSTFLRQSPAFAVDVFEILYPQFLKFYEKDVTVPAPLLLQACIDTGHAHVRLCEPLPALLAVLCQTLQLLLQGEADRIPRYLACQDLLNTLSRRLLKADLEDFELDKGGDWAPTSHAGSRNLLKAQLLVGCYEVLLAYSYTSSPRPRDAETWQLVQRFHRRIEDLAFLKSPAGGLVVELLAGGPVRVWIPPPLIPPFPHSSRCTHTHTHTHRLGAGAGLPGRVLPGLPCLGQPGRGLSVLPDPHASSPGVGGAEGGAAAATSGAPGRVPGLPRHPAQGAREHQAQTGLAPGVRGL